MCFISNVISHLVVKWSVTDVEHGPVHVHVPAACIGGEPVVNIAGDLDNSTGTSDKEVDHGDDVDQAAGPGTAQQSDSLIPQLGGLEAPSCDMPGDIVANSPDFN